MKPPFRSVNDLRRFLKRLKHGKLPSIDIVNEAVNAELRSIFIAVPKTGTSSVRIQIRPAGTPLVPNPHLNIVQVRDLLYPFLLRSALGGNDSFPSKDVPTDEDVRAEARRMFESFFKFSGVRNPWARAVSLYFRRERIKVSESLTFEEFCEQHAYASDACAHPTLHKNQFDWLCDESGGLLMDFVYKVEEFDDAIREIRERTEGRVDLVQKVLNRNPQSRSSDYRSMYNQRTKDLIAKVYEKDIDWFKYSF